MQLQDIEALQYPYAKSDCIPSMKLSNIQLLTKLRWLIDAFLFIVLVLFCDKNLSSNIMQAASST
jgi:hypothetical protein